jgi:magnesium-transporting ATPase (P-type)
MTHPAIATAADYADALLTARRFKSVLLLLVLLTLLLELVLFFTARYGGGILPEDVTTATTVASTQPTSRPMGATMLQYLTVVGTFVGFGATLVMSFVLLLIAGIMLVGRLIGVGRVTEAYLWCVVLLALLFPWQAIFLNPTMNPTGATTVNDFRIPGVLYTWTELSHPTLGAKFGASNPSVATLRWARFVGFPCVAIVCVLLVQAKSNKALRQALGEQQPDTMPEDVPPA